MRLNVLFGENEKEIEDLGLTIAKMSHDEQEKLLDAPRVYKGFLGWIRAFFYQIFRIKDTMWLYLLTKKPLKIFALFSNDLTIPEAYHATIVQKIDAAFLEVRQGRQLIADILPLIYLIKKMPREKLTEVFYLEDKHHERVLSLAIKKHPKLAELILSELIKEHPHCVSFQIFERNDLSTNPLLLALEYAPGVVKSMTLAMGRLPTLPRALLQQVLAANNITFEAYPALLSYVLTLPKEEPLKVALLEFLLVRYRFQGESALFHAQKTKSETVALLLSAISYLPNEKQRTIFSDLQQKNTDFHTLFEGIKGLEPQKHEQLLANLLVTREEGSENTLIHTALTQPELLGEFLENTAALPNATQQALFSTVFEHEGEFLSEIIHRLVKTIAQLHSKSPTLLPNFVTACSRHRGQLNKTAALQPEIMDRLFNLILQQPDPSRDSLCTMLITKGINEQAVLLSPTVIVNILPTLLKKERCYYIRENLIYDLELDKVVIQVAKTQPEQLEVFLCAIAAIESGIQDRVFTNLHQRLQNEKSVTQTMETLLQALSRINDKQKLTVLLRHFVRPPFMKIFIKQPHLVEAMLALLEPGDQRLHTDFMEQFLLLLSLTKDDAWIHYDNQYRHFYDSLTKEEHIPLKLEPTFCKILIMHLLRLSQEQRQTLLSYVRHKTSGALMQKMFMGVATLPDLKDQKTLITELLAHYHFADFDKKDKNPFQFAIEVFLQWNKEEKIFVLEWLSRAVLEPSIKAFIQLLKLPAARVKPFLSAFQALPKEEKDSLIARGSDAISASWSTQALEMLQVSVSFFRSQFSRKERNYFASVFYEMFVPSIYKKNNDTVRRLSTISANSDEVKPFNQLLEMVAQLPLKQRQEYVVRFFKQSTLEISTLRFALKNIEMLLPREHQVSFFLDTLSLRDKNDFSFLMRLLFNEDNESQGAWDEMVQFLSISDQSSVLFRNALVFQIQSIFTKIEQNALSIENLNLDIAEKLCSMFQVELSRPIPVNAPKDEHGEEGDPPMQQEDEGKKEEGPMPPARAASYAFFTAPDEAIRRRLSAENTGRCNAFIARLHQERKRREEAEHLRQAEEARRNHILEMTRQIEEALAAARSHVYSARPCFA